MKVVIAGGTGFIGKRLVAALRARGDEVVVLSRAAASSAHGERHLRWQGGDDAWTREVDGAGAVINLAGAPIADGRWTAARLALIGSSRVTSTRLVAQAIAAAAHKPSVLVNASAVGVYGLHAEGPEFDESSPPARDTLGSICAAWEAEAQHVSATGTRVAIARIGVVLGEEGGALAKMLPPFKAFAGGPIGAGSQVLSWITADDCVRALLFAVDEARAVGPFNVCAPAPATMDAFAQALGRVLGRPSILRVPAFVLRAALGEMAGLVLLGQRAVPRQLVRWGFTFDYPSLEAALGHLLVEA